MKLILIGPRSVGKSSVGSCLAKKLNVKYFDFDEYVDEKIGGIDKYIESTDVRSYRLEEKKLLSKFLSSLPKNCVISVGGGTIASQFKDMNKTNTTKLRSVGTIIYLFPTKNRKKAADILFAREKKRKGDKTYAETLKLLKIRAPLYEDICDIKIEVNTKSPFVISKDILLQLKK